MPSADEILQKMREVKERQLAAARPLVEVLAQRSTLLEQLAELDEPYGKAYVDAEAAGWTAEQLANIGADEPVQRPRVRSKRSRSSAKRADGQSAGTTAEGSSPAGTIPAQEGASATAGATSSA